MIIWYHSIIVFLHAERENPPLFSKKNMQIFKKILLHFQKILTLLRKILTLFQRHEKILTLLILTLSGADFRLRATHK